jgi:hypothetical protein
VRGGRELNHKGAESSILFLHLFFRLTDTIDPHNKIQPSCGLYTLFSSLSFPLSALNLYHNIKYFFSGVRASFLLGILKYNTLIDAYRENNGI